MGSKLESLQKLNKDIDNLIAKRVAASDGEFITWRTKAIGILRKLFGVNSSELISFLNISFDGFIISVDDTKEDEIRYCRAGLESCKAVFEGYIELFEDDVADDEVKATEAKKCSNQIFVVHGRDGELKEKVARLLENQGLEPIILSEQVNQGKTIIEKFESYGSAVGAAICLFTADDLGKYKDDEELKARARQNVVLEAGYFIGKLGRERIILIADSGIELPSDLQGVVYTNRDVWRFEVLKELRAMGY